MKTDQIEEGVPLLVLSLSHPGTTFCPAGADRRQSCNVVAHGMNRELSGSVTPSAGVT